MRLLRLSATARGTMAVARGGQKSVPERVCEPRPRPSASGSTRCPGGGLCGVVAADNDGRGVAVEPPCRRPGGTGGKARPLHG